MTNWGLPGLVSADRRNHHERSSTKSPVAVAAPGNRPEIGTGAAFAEPGTVRIGTINWGGLKALYMKEVRRFFKVQLQTIWAPAITTMLYLVIFTVALGRSGRTVLDVPFSNFLAPGLIVMAMMQNSFANSSFSLLVGKIRGRSSII